MVDFSKIKAPKKEVATVDPVELFQKIKVVDPNINDLWLAQGDALRDWHENRGDKDVGIVLNTGAGKTLVGLLVAQSLVNETRGKVLYACSSIQLVEQTAEKASGYGLGVTTYFRGKYSNDTFHKCEAPCVTTYQALFNGRSVFFREELAAVIFDDAHAAEHLLRDHFTVSIDRGGFDELYASSTALFEDYFRNVGKAATYSEIRLGSSDRVLMVPPFEVQRTLSELSRILHEARLGEARSTMFAWRHIKDHLDMCCLLVSATSISITPPFVPVLSLPYFSQDLRRVYLSATLTAPDAFARTFGRVPDRVVAPNTTAAECERLILSALNIDPEDEGVGVTREILQSRKALILIPKYSRAEIWSEVAEPPPREEVTAHVLSFKESAGTPKLLLAARYDGVDLPGDTCRLMVIDDLPMGMGPLERFLWESLAMNNSLKTATASRIVQSFGRISRGMSDHGVVVVTGKKLVEWLRVPNNVAILPAFLQKQILLGWEISAQCDDLKDMHQSIDACLSRDPQWIGAYEDFMENAESIDIQPDMETLQKLAVAEAQYAQQMWIRDYEAAAKALSETLDDAFDLSESTGAWHCLWLGFAQELMGDLASANTLYARAHSHQTNIPSVRRFVETKPGSKVHDQVHEVCSQIGVLPSGTVTLPKSLSSDLSVLGTGGSSNQVEEGLRALGQYLGLESTRPDKEFGTGPDVLWCLGDEIALCIEAKTNKEESLYTKKEVGQMSDHIQWIQDQRSIDNVVPVFVGPVVGATNSTNPSEALLVCSLKEFEVLSQRLFAALQDATADALPLTLAPQVQETFEKRGLLVPELVESLNCSHVRDL